MKSTWHGMGLGLSLSYYIVKAHGGVLSVELPSEKVETMVNGGLPDAASTQSGSEFIIQLPIV